MRQKTTTDSKSSDKRTHNTSTWIKIKNFLNQPLTKKKAKKLDRKSRPFFLETLADLLSEGFTLMQALDFMKLLLKPYAHLIDDVVERLNKGESFERSIQPLGFSIVQVAQFFYAQRQGRFQESLKNASKQLKQQQEYQEKLVKQLVYPVILAIFLNVLLLAMRSFLLPHISGFITQDTYNNNLLVRVLISFFVYLPHIYLYLGIALIFLYVAYDFYYMKLNYLDRFKLLLKLPIVKKWVRLYCSYHLAKEFSYFFAGGYSMQQTLKLWHKYPVDPFLSELAIILNEGFLKGEEFSTMIEETGLFTKELPLVIYQGELTSELASKTDHYSKKIFADLMEDISKKISMIQPIMFIIIAVLVMAMYLLIMLPTLTMEF